MQTVNIKRKRLCLGAFFILIIYFLLKPRKYNFNASVILNKSGPREVWEFVADFNNIKFLNPTITGFSILTESGNYEHWKYAAEYTENLSHWPYLSNTAIAQFDVKALKSEKYQILSSHRTCLILNLLCVHSKSEFQFTKVYRATGGAFCEENIEYECPPLFSIFCKYEVQFQRSAIMNNLKKHFG